MALFAQRLLYQILLWLVLPLIPLRLLVRGLKERGYWWHVAERFGGGNWLDSHPVWIHAVSVGEVRAAAPLVEHFITQAMPVLITCMTPAGRATAEQIFGERAQVRYLPYDYAFAVRRFLRRTQPARGIIMETELWPSLVRESSRAGVPMYLVNARLSEKSANGYRKFTALTRSVLGGFAAVAAQTAEDADRLRTLGAKNIEVTGNLKFDIEPPANQIALGATFRSWIGRRPVWLAASTRDGEEKLILDAFRMAAPEVLLILVPRHPQRFDEVAALVKAAGLTMQRRSDHSLVQATTQVWLGDSLGEMFAYYAAADSALIGGSLLSYGGQNLIEACSVGCPVLIGSHTENFRQATIDAIESSAALRVPDAQAWAEQALRLTQDESARKQMGEAGKKFAAAHKGAAAKVITLLG